MLSKRSADILKSNIIRRLTIILECKTIWIAISIAVYCRCTWFHFSRSTRSTFSRMHASDVGTIVSRALYIYISTIPCNMHGAVLVNLPRTYVARKPPPCRPWRWHDNISDGTRRNRSGHWLIRSLVDIIGRVLLMRLLSLFALRMSEAQHKVTINVVNVAHVRVISS